MTPQTDPRQALITEIDTVLSKSQSRLPWVMAGEVTQQRRVLKRVRDYLGSLSDRSSNQRQLPPGRSRNQTSRAPSRRRQSLLGAPLGDESSNNSPRDSSLNQQIVQAVVADMRSSVLAPLEAEIAALREEREQMRQELRSLDLERRSSPMAGQSQAAMSEFFQTLIDRCAENLTQQVAQNLAQMQIDILQYKATPPHDPVLAPGDRALLTPQERLEQLQAIQSQSDRLLKTLDASINVVFETLQSNLKSYSESMTQGVEHMYSLGQQGEVMFSALINQLASQLGREASSYIQSHADESTGGSLDSIAEKSLTSGEMAELTEINNTEIDKKSEEITNSEYWTSSDAEANRDPLETIDPPHSESVTTEDTLVLEDLTLEIFNELDDLTNAETDDSIDTVEDPPSSTETAAQRDERVAEANALYDDLFNSDRFISNDALSLENEEDPLQELLLQSASAPEPELQERIESNEEDSEEEVSAIADDPESLESNLFDGLEIAAVEDPQMDGADESSEIESPEPDNFPEETDPLEESPKLESALFEGAPPPTQVDDPASLATFMELFGDDDASESLQTHLISDASLETDDIYIPASPDENLLPSNDENLEGTPSQLDLDSSVLNQLSQDLFSLEDELNKSGSELDGISEFAREPDEEEDSSLATELEIALDGGETLLLETSSDASEAILDSPTPDNSTPDNFLDDILSPSSTREEPLPDLPVAETAIAEGSPEPPASENLFEVFAEEEEARQSASFLEEGDRENLALLLEPESEATLDLPESLTIDTVFEEPLLNSESSNLDTDALVSSTADRPLESTVQNNSPSPENTPASSPQGTATLENMFESFLRGEGADSSDSSGNSLFSPDQPTDTEQSFTLDDVFEDFTEE